ncbi:hypothetical protein BKA64DRAFT_664502 [Cadophora sp. MPI-SDFR-AT-0126]|nr:hypothetical protein BKA64DRAFT_664502 [Leotiomycetes sp. MPI-SDFR-AT-0126]
MEISRGSLALSILLWPVLVAQLPLGYHPCLSLSPSLTVKIAHIASIKSMCDIESLPLHECQSSLPAGTARIPRSSS